MKKKCTSSKLSRIKNMLGYEISAEIPLESILKRKTQRFEKSFLDLLSFTTSSEKALFMAIT